MAFLSLDNIIISCKATQHTFPGISSAATGPAADVYMIPAWASDVTIQGIASVAAVYDVELTADSQANVLAGTAIWAKYALFTGWTNVGKIDTFQGPLTAVRVNVTTGVAGTIILCIKSDAPSQ